MRCFSGSFFKRSVDSSVVNIGIAMIFSGSVGLFWMYLKDVKCEVALGLLFVMMNYI